MVVRNCARLRFISADAGAFALCVTAVAGTIGAIAKAIHNTTQNTQIAGLQAFDVAVGNRVGTLKADVDNLDNRIERFGKRASSGTATAIALSGGAFLPDKQFNVTANMGVYGGAVAGALQIGAMVSPNAAVADVAKGFNKNGKVGARAGVTLGF